MPTSTCAWRDPVRKVNEHRQIFEAAMNGQEARAALALEVHIRATVDQLIQAQRGYQANLSVIQRATESYNTALQIGRA